jgi:(2Fe-2S) ferredoxin
MVIYPQGVWYKYKNFEDVDEIINSHLIKGKIVRRLLLKT